ncbi:MAG TPA: metallopeptidase family protein [Candidatus Dormibacteraeota bacterium]|nr:metallopeptidase family protein [Candidatus Dormibacteraeota bacterium]
MPRRAGRETERRRRARFGRLVEEAVDDLKVEIAARRDGGQLSPRLAHSFLEAIEHVAILTADEPDARQREENERAEDLLGIYEGVPLTEWAADQALLPPRITIFRRATEALSPSPSRQREEVRKTVKHEIAHHLGWSDERLNELGLGDAD